MDKKYNATTLSLPAKTVEMLDEIRTCLEATTGIVKLSRRQVVESLISQKMETLYHAADRIEELEAALRYLVDECDEDMDDDYNPHSAPLAQARAALVNSENGKGQENG